MDFLYGSQLHMRETTSPSSSLPGTKIRQREMVRKDYFVDGKDQGHSKVGIAGIHKVSSAAAKLAGVCRRPEMALL